MPPPSTVTIRVPGSTSNLGPGFDTLGIALRVYNRITVTPVARRGTRACITSPISESGRPGATRLVQEAARLFFRRSRTRPFAFDIHLSGDVPIARGLGSSVTVRLGVIAALDALTGTVLERQTLFQWVTDLEGHPDNAAPATFGGFTASALIGKQARCVPVPTSPRLRFVTLIPDFEIETAAARRLVPDSFSKTDTLHNLTRVGLIVAALARGELGGLRGAFEDRIHQPYRQVLIPQLPRVLRAGERAGAVGGWLSGSGSTIICLTDGNADAVAAAMLEQMPRSEVRILAADRGGFTVEKA